jgi:hypothetical protein
VEVHAAVDDLRTRLAEAADQAAQLARAPGAAETLRRVRARRRRRAGGALLALAVVAAAAAAGRGGLLTLPDTPTAQRPRDLAWRPLVAKEWRGTVPGERPLDPVLVAAEGEQARDPWRLVVYRSGYHPGGGRPPVTDVCYILEWFTMELGRPAPWQLHGTCAPERQPATVLAAGGPDGGKGLTAVVGRAPDTATRVRLEFRDRPPVETATVRPGAGVLGRFYVVFVPRAGYLERMVGLDDDGNEVAAAPGQGDLSRRLLGGFPPTGPVSVVATVPTTPAGAVEVVAWPVRDGFCMAVETEGGGGSSQCGSLPAGESGLEPRLECSRQSPGRELRLLYGGVPRAARTVTFQAAGERVEVPVRDGGPVLDRAFFATVISRAASRTDIRVTARDARGQVLWSEPLPYRCG